MARGNSLGRWWEILILDEGAFAFVHFSFWLAVVIQADMRRFFFFFIFFSEGETMMLSPGLPFNAQSGVLSSYRCRIPTAVA